MLNSICSRRPRGRAAALFATLCVLTWSAGPSATTARAQDYPAKRVTIIVPFAAGGSADVYGRILAQHLQQDLGQPFTVENRPGAGAILGTEAVKNAPPDGYTLLLMSNTHTVNETLIPKKSYALMRDLMPVAPINFADLVLVTRPKLGISSIADLIKVSKEKPGGVTFASSGPGTPYHMAGEMFKAMAGVNIVHVPYRGSSGARTDVLAGHVDMMFDAPTTMVQFVKSGEVQALATTGKTKSADMPDLPTVGDTVPGYEAVIWLGVMAPRGTPAAIIEKLNASISKIVRQPDIQASWKKQGAEPMVMSPAQFTDYMNADIKKWADVIRLSGVKLD